MKLLSRKTLVPAIVVLIVVIAAAWAWRSGSNAPETRYKTEVVERNDVVQNVSANGTLNPVILVSVGTQVSGTVKKTARRFQRSGRAGADPRRTG